MESGRNNTYAASLREGRGWIAALQSARFPFALLVWLSHLEVPSLSAPFDFGGECAVSFFFVLSGFLLARAYGGRVADGGFSTRGFLFRHFCKLYPLHLLLFAAVLALDTADGRVWSPVQLAANLLLVQTWLPSGSFTFIVNGVSWYLCDIFFFYLAFALLYRVAARLSLRQSVAAFALYAVVYAALVWRMPEQWVNPVLYVNPLLRLPDFAAGIVLFRLCVSPRAGSFAQRCPVCVLRALPVALVFAAWWLYGLLPHSVGCQLLLLPFSAAVVGLLFLADGRKLSADNCRLSADTRKYSADTRKFSADTRKFSADTRKFSVDARKFSVGTRRFSVDTCKFLVDGFLHSRAGLWLGGVSFEFYMCHPLVFRLVRRVFAPDGTFAADVLYAALSLLLSVALAWALARFFVQPVKAGLLRAGARLS